MDYSLIISIIIGVICITCLIIFYVKIYKINENLDKHITTDLKELPDEITLNKLKVKDLEVEDSLSASLIYNKNNDLPITISSPSKFTKDMIIQNDNLYINSNKILLNSNIFKVNPDLKLTTEFDKDKATKYQKPTSLVNINDDNSDINMEFNLNDVVYTLYNNEKMKEKYKIKENSIKEISKEDIIKTNNEKIIKSITEPTRDVNIDYDEYFIYDNHGHKIGILTDKLIQKSCFNGTVYDVNGEIMEESIESPSCNFSINKLYLKENDIIHISQKIYDHLQNGIKEMENRIAINTLMYPNYLINKIKNNKYVINPDAKPIKNYDQIKLNLEPVETFIDIPSYNYYVYE